MYLSLDMFVFAHNYFIVKHFKHLTVVRWVSWTLVITFMVQCFHSTGIPLIVTLSGDFDFIKSLHPTLLCLAATFLKSQIAIYSYVKSPLVQSYWK